MAENDVFLFNPNAPAEPTNEQFLSELDVEEAASIVRLPSIDPKSLYGANKAKLFGQAFTESLIQQAVDTPATSALLLGREWQEEGKPAGDKLVTVGEKARNFGIALRNKAGLTEGNAEVPGTFSEKLVSGLGSGTGSILGMVAAALAGGATGATLASAAVGPEAAPLGAAAGSTTAAFLSSYYNERAMMAQELMDAGYGPDFADKVGSLYAFPVASLDVASFKILGKLLRPVAAGAIKSTAGKFAINLLKSTAEGAISEGGTEAIQQRIQTETEIATNIRTRDAMNDIVDDAVAFLVGGLLGGTTGTVGQLKSRGKMIDTIVEKTGADRKIAASAVDDYLLNANSDMYDVLSEKLDVTEETAWVDKAFKKVEGQTALPAAEQVTPTEAPEEVQRYQDLYEAVRVDEKAKSILSSLETAYMKRFEARNAEGPKVRDEAAKALMKKKIEYKQFLAENPYLQQLTERLDELQGQWEKAAPSQKTAIEEEMKDIAFRLRNPGEVEEVVAAAEEEAIALQSKAEELATNMQQPQEGKTVPTEEEFVRATQEYLAAERRAQGYRAVGDAIRYGESLTRSQVRKEARANLSRIVDAYKAGKRVQEADVKEMQRAFRVLLAGQKVSAKTAARLLRGLLTIRTAQDFNEKIGVILDAANQVIRSEKVRQYQILAGNILRKILPGQQAGKVSPENQLFAEHLNRLLRGKAEMVYQTDTATEEQKAVESAVYDLANAGDNDLAAARATKVLSDFYKNGLSEYKGFREAQRAEEVRLTKQLINNILGGVPFDALKEAYDSARQKDQTQDAGFRMTPYDTSVTSILDILDAPEKVALGQGTLGKAFDSNKPYLALVTLRGQAKEQIDGKLYAVYGRDAQKFWYDARTAGFLDIELEEGRKISISRAGAMSLWLMTKMPGTYNDLLNQGINQAWLDSFQRGENVSFTKQDYQFMQEMRNTLDWFADRIAPVYERVTHRPFRRVDDYFLTSRFFADSADVSGYTENTSVIDAMLNGDFSEVNPADIDALKSRVKKSKRLFQIPDILEAVTFYATDMTHFIAYAEYVTRMRNVFSNPEVRQIMQRRAPVTYLAVIDEYLKFLTGGLRTAERTGMRRWHKALGLYARNQTISPKNFLRQLSGVAAAMDFEGAGPVKLVQAIADLPRAIKTGEIKNITETEYMKDRFAGAYDMAVLYVREQTQKGGFKGDISQKLHDFFTTFPRYGDRLASIATGWMIYRDQMSKTGNPAISAAKAIEVIDATQVSFDAGKAPIAFSNPGLLHRLITTFNRFPGIFLDRYLRTWRGFLKGQVPTTQFIRTMITAHFWVPVVDTLITAGRFEKDETLFAMGLGPLSYHLILGQAIRSIVAGVMEGWTGGQADLPGYLKDASNGTLVGSFARDITKLVREITKLVNYPDFEYMWDTTKAFAQAAEAVVPVPTGWLAATPQAIYELLQGTPDDMIKGAKRLAGWTDARLNE